MFDNNFRRERLPSNWRYIRLKRLKMDNFSCQWIQEDGTKCLKSANEVDHIEAMKDDHRIESLQSLCVSHHRTKTGREGNKAKRLKEESLKKMYLRPKESRFD